MLYPVIYYYELFFLQYKLVLYIFFHTKYNNNCAKIKVVFKICDKWLK